MVLGFKYKITKAFSNTRGTKVTPEHALDQICHAVVGIMHLKLILEQKGSNKCSAPSAVCCKYGHVIEIQVQVLAHSSFALKERYSSYAEEFSGSGALDGSDRVGINITRRDITAKSNRQLKAAIHRGKQLKYANDPPEKQKQKNDLKVYTQNTIIHRNGTTFDSQHANPAAVNKGRQIVQLHLVRSRARRELNKMSVGLHVLASRKKRFYLKSLYRNRSNDACGRDINIG